MSIKVRSKAKTAASYFGTSSLMGKAMSAVMVIRHRCRFKPYRSDEVDVLTLYSSPHKYELFTTLTNDQFSLSRNKGQQGGALQGFRPAMFG